MDICDAQQRAYDGSLYYLVIHDEYSKHVQVAQLRNKSTETVLSVFWKYLLEMERLLGKKVK